MASTSTLKQQLVPFLLIGVGCAVIDFGITYTLNEPLGWQRDFAKAVGWVFGTIAAYVLNSKFSFNAKINAKKAGAVFVPGGAFTPVDGVHSTLRLAYPFVEAERLVDVASVLDRIYQR